VSSVLAADGRAWVEKLNLVKRHQRPTQKLPQGGMVEKEAPFRLSNLMLFCSKCGKGTRAGVKMEKDGKKETRLQKVW
jgi:large subunit ribosomal protein L24